MAPPGSSFPERQIEKNTQELAQTQPNSYNVLQRMPEIPSAHIYFRENRSRLTTRENVWRAAQGVAKRWKLLFQNGERSLSPRFAAIHRSN